MEKIKLGIFGVGPRGCQLGKDFLLAGCEIVAVCDCRIDREAVARKEFSKDFVFYTEFDKFINHEGIEAVLLTNYFHDHAPYAIKCFEKGIHVYSECISNGTMAEGVSLVRAFLKSNVVYMLGENYPQMLFNREMKRVRDTGSLGKFLYAEGEYNHPTDVHDITFAKDYKYFERHWRHFLPRSYYVTHSLGPIMAASGATPKRVTAFNCYAPILDDAPIATYVADRATIITTLNDDGSVFKVTGCAAFGAHYNSYRVCGTAGQIENIRGIPDKVMLRYNSWQTPEGVETEHMYVPDWNDKDVEIIQKSSHGGADYLTVRTFVECIKEGKQPPHPFDVFSAVAMSSVAILGHRSALAGGMPYDIPDFRREEDCKAYENDYLSPFWRGDIAPTLPCSSDKDFKPTETQLRLFRERVLGGEISGRENDADLGAKF